MATPAELEKNQQQLEQDEQQREAQRQEQERRRRQEWYRLNPLREEFRDRDGTRWIRYDHGSNTWIDQRGRQITRDSRQPPAASHWNRQPETQTRRYTPAYSNTEEGSEDYGSMSERTFVRNVRLYKAIRSGDPESTNDIRTRDQAYAYLKKANREDIDLDHDELFVPPIGALPGESAPRHKLKIPDETEIGYVWPDRTVYEKNFMEGTGVPLRNIRTRLKKEREKPGMKTATFEKMIPSIFNEQEIKRGTRNANRLWDEGQRRGIEFREMMLRRSAHNPDVTKGLASMFSLRERNKFTIANTDTGGTYLALGATKRRGTHTWIQIDNGKFRIVTAPITADRDHGRATRGRSKQIYNINGEGKITKLHTYGGAGYPVYKPGLAGVAQQFFDTPHGQMVARGEPIKVEVGIVKWKIPTPIKLTEGGTNALMNSSVLLGVGGIARTAGMMALRGAARRGTLYAFREGGDLIMVEGVLEETGQFAASKGADAIYSVNPVAGTAALALSSAGECELSAPNPKNIGRKFKDLGTPVFRRSDGTIDNRKRPTTDHTTRDAYTNLYNQEQRFANLKHRNKQLAQQLQNANAVTIAFDAKPKTRFSPNAWTSSLHKTQSGQKTGQKGPQSGTTPGSQLTSEWKASQRTTQATSTGTQISGQTGQDLSGTTDGPSIVYPGQTPGTQNDIDTNTGTQTETDTDTNTGTQTETDTDTNTGGLDGRQHIYISKAEFAKLKGIRAKTGVDMSISNYLGIRSGGKTAAQIQSQILAAQRAAADRKAKAEADLKAKADAAAAAEAQAKADAKAKANAAAAAAAQAKADAAAAAAAAAKAKQQATAAAKAQALAAAKAAAAAKAQALAAQRAATQAHFKALAATRAKITVQQRIRGKGTVKGKSKQNTTIKGQYKGGTRVTYRPGAIRGRYRPNIITGTDIRPDGDPVFEPESYYEGDIKHTPQRTDPKEDVRTPPGDTRFHWDPRKKYRRSAKGKKKEEVKAKSRAKAKIKLRMPEAKEDTLAIGIDEDTGKPVYPMVIDVSTKKLVDRVHLNTGEVNTRRRQPQESVGVRVIKTQLRRPKRNIKTVERFINERLPRNYNVASAGYAKSYGNRLKRRIA